MAEGKPAIFACYAERERPHACAYFNRLYFSMTSKLTASPHPVLFQPRCSVFAMPLLNCHFSLKQGWLPHPPLEADGGDTPPPQPCHSEIQIEVLLDWRVMVSLCMLNNISGQSLLPFSSWHSFPPGFVLAQILACSAPLCQ